MQMAAVDSELAHDLDRGVRALTSVLRREMRAGLSLPALYVLVRLRDEGPQRVTDLAAAEQVTQPAMTALVGRLERRGLLTRGPDPDDGRVVRVTITPDGARLLDEVRARRAQRLAERVESLSPEHREALRRAVPALLALTDPTR
jgi:DNA-binding MarR family transcriptional regulator